MILSKKTINQIKKYSEYINNPTEVRKYISSLTGLKKTAANKKYHEIFTTDRPRLNIKGNAHVKIIESLDDKIKTLNELVEVSKIDLNDWKPEKITAGEYAGNFQFKAEFKPISKDLKLNDILISDLKEDIKSFSPVIRKIPAQNNRAGLLLEVPIFDLHLGKLAWKETSGEDFDLNIAKKIYIETLYSIITKALLNGPIEKILFPIGNDFLTIDNNNNETSRGTPQNVDSRFPKIFREGRKILVEAINILKTIAPVDVIVVVGNHDKNSMFHLGDSIECWFHKDENVSVNNLAISRKYYEYGQNLITFSHGHEKIKKDKLLILASTEYPNWSKFKFKEWHFGHFHHEECVEISGIKMRIMPSITGTDEYHYENGYVDNIKCSQGFLFDKEKGLQAIVYSDPIELEKLL